MVQLVQQLGILIGSARDTDWFSKETDWFNHRERRIAIQNGITAQATVLQIVDIILIREGNNANARWNIAYNIEQDSTMWDDSKI